MSNTPDVDPVGHAAKFIAIFAAIPVIFGAIALALPPTDPPPPAAATAAPFVGAALLLAVAFGVYRRSIAAVWIGLTLFGAAVVGLLAMGLLAEKKGGAFLFWIVLFIWPVIKLWAAKEAMRS